MGIFYSRDFNLCINSNEGEEWKKLLFSVGMTKRDLYKIYKVFYKYIRIIHDHTSSLSSAAATNKAITSSSNSAGDGAAGVGYLEVNTHQKIYPVKYRPKRHLSARKLAASIKEIDLIAFYHIIDYNDITPFSKRIFSMLRTQDYNISNNAGSGGHLRCKEYLNIFEFALGLWNFCTMNKHTAGKSTCRSILLIALLTCCVLKAHTVYPYTLSSDII